MIDTFRLQWEEHDSDKETLEDYNQRMLQLMIDDLETMTLHGLVRRVQEVYCPSPADYITIVTMQCFDESPHFPMFRAIVRSLVDPTNLENTSDGRKIFVVPNVTYARLCEIFDFNVHVSRIDVKYTTTADALVYERDLDGQGTGAWLHLSLLSRLEGVFSTSVATSRDAAKELATRCMRRNLTDRKTLLYFNK